MTEMILIRHGRSIMNEEKRIQGQSESDLSETGRRQAEALARRWRGTTVDAIYSSDLKRAMQTAEYSAAEIGLEIKLDDRLREKKMGIFEKLNREEVEARYPEEFQKLRSRDPAYVIPEGESTLQLQERVVSFCRELALDHQNQRILVFTHGGVIHSFFHYVFNIPYLSWRWLSNYNTSVNIFENQEDQWRLLTWGDVNHLSGNGLL